MLDMPIADVVDLALPVVVDDSDLTIVDVHPTWPLMNHIVVPTRLRRIGTIGFRGWGNGCWFRAREPWNAWLLWQRWLCRRNLRTRNARLGNGPPADDTR